MNKSPKDYLQTEKFIRDLVHGYVYITKFEREIIDTVAFQRLKDIRQLTCQHVYPAARHTRFEHSLGVLELTRQALKHLNNNGFIHLRGTDTPADTNKKLLSDNLVFNGTLAALLHDVGHCPFSHLGETMFDEDEVNERLFELVTGTYTQKFRAENTGIPDDEIGLTCAGDKAVEELRTSALAKKFKADDNRNEGIPGATHEKMSCIVIMGKFYTKLKEVEQNCQDLKVDFELLFRCILGIEYDVSPKMFQEDEMVYNENREKNVIVNLINSKIFDMDKLDYIMRDACMTGIGTPSVDTKRLFRNMYLSEDYTLVFTNRAVPALQNMIEARDGLYMYVYNHHAVVYSDFMNSYTFRRMDHDYRDYKNTFLDLLRQKRDGDNVSGAFSDIENLCFISKNMIFSVGAVLDDNRSDSDMVSFLNMQYQFIKKIKNRAEWIIDNLVKDLKDYGISIECSEIERLEKENIDGMAIGIGRTFELLEKYLKRDYLKPWWKTNFEFNNFINKNFTDDKVRETLCRWVCNKRNETPEGAEFRSQLAKHVCYITQEIYKNQKDKRLGDGDFFIVQRPTSFFSPDAIKKLDIALKKSEILGSPNEAKYQTDSFYIKELTNIIPQRSYDSFYSKNSFYIYSKKLKDDESTRKQDYYLNLEKIFVFVATSLIKQGEAKFQANFAVKNKDTVRKNEERSNQEMLREYYNVYPNDTPGV